MNYSTDVKFSNNLVRNGNVTISYSGSLFRTGSESVTLVYGFGDKWENQNEKEMTKNENNFSTEIKLLDYDKINFCFRNSDNIWDNNNYLDYTAPISKPEEEYNFIINESLMGEMLNNLFEIDLSNSNNQTNSPIELVENSIVSEESFSIEIPENKPADIQEFAGETVEEEELTKDLELAFFSEDTESQDIKKENIVNFDMDSIIEEILSPIIEAKTVETSKNTPDTTFKQLDAELEQNFFDFSLDDQSDILAETLINDFDDNILIENIEGTTNNEVSEESLLDDLNKETALIEVENTNNSFIVSPRSLNKFYMFKKRIKLAFYKFFTAIPKIIESAFDTEKN